MASPVQGRGSCGHIMAALDGHDKCAQCREKGVSQDACVLGNPCLICENLTNGPDMLVTLTCKIRKDKIFAVLTDEKDGLGVGLIEEHAETPT